MLAAVKKQVLKELVSGASYEELVWINGYLAGMLSVTNDNDRRPQEQQSPGKITIVYGTETGNAKSLATRLTALAKKQGVNVKLTSLEQYRLNDLAKEEILYIIISTQGDGEPPAAAKKFYDHIHDPALQLPELKYGVIALGDVAYPLFCQAGIVTDQQLERTGATRIATVCKCDTNYETIAMGWFEQALQALSAGKKEKAVTLQKTGKKNYSGKVIANINLNDHGSAKETFHIELEAENVRYEPGDSLSIIPQNPRSIVTNIIAQTGIDPGNRVRYRGEEKTVQELLDSSLNITYLHERTVKQYAAIVQQEIPEAKIGLADLLRIYPVADAAQFEQVIGILEPVTPRLYSISSAPSAHGGALHLTVSRHRFQVNGTTHYGFCSDHLSQQQENTALHFSIHANHLFRLPAADKDIIMIGPGTGIAPFRSFLAERDATNATGRNWLFFGEQHFTTDFLYQTELQDWFNTGLLTKISLAFSRDQQEKVYVQHKLLQHGKEVYQWLCEDAYLYVCGTRDPMSIDVEKALLQVFITEGSHTEETAMTFLRQLKEEGRYLQDVY